MIRPAISFPPELWAAIKEYAAIENLSAADIVRRQCDAIPALLAKRKKAQTPENLGPSVATEFERFAELVRQNGRDAAETLQRVNSYLESKIP